MNSASLAATPLLPFDAPGEAGRFGAFSTNSENLAQLLHERANKSPDALAYRFVGKGESAEEITYAELDARARAVAATIMAATGARPHPMLLLFAPGLDYIVGLFGCFYAGAPAVPAFPPDPTRLARTLPRLVAIMDDAGSDVVLTTSDLEALMAGFLATTRRSLRVIATDRISTGGEGLAPTVRPEMLALLQYTSGSTSLPRGVMLSHTQLLTNCRDIGRGFGLHRGSSAGLWLPPYHDMGLIGGILTPLLWGIPVSLMSPVSFVQRPLSWLHMVSRYRTTVIGGPNFAYDLCARRAKDADLEGLDLSGVELAFTGAEPIRVDTIERFVERFGPYGFRAEAFYPCYGLAEATLFVTGAKRLTGWRAVSVARDALEFHGTARPAGPEEPSRSLVSCGAPGPSTRLRIADPATGEPLPDGVVGEIWIHSPSVADGYWRRPEETAAAFGAMTTGGEGPYLRSGDLGFILDGELFVAGRMKDLIVINGRNHYPIDIERVCETSVTGIRRNCGAAFAIEDDASSAERLVLVYEANPGDADHYQATIDELRRTVSLELSVPAHAVVLIRPRTVPKTSSGKVQRWLTRRHYLAGELDELARWQAPTRPAAAP